MLDRDAILSFRLNVGGALRAGRAETPVIDPATGRAFAVAPLAGPADLDEAVAAGQRALAGWEALGWDGRAALLCRWADAIETRAEELAELLTREQGKPLAAARSEILGCAHFLRGTAALRLPVEVLRDTSERRIEAQRVPLGVVGAITPWNLPVLLSAAKVAPNLLAGNAVVLKSAPSTPLTLLRLGEIAAGILPEGVFSVLSGDNALGACMTAHPGIAKISFTGSTETGRKVAASAAVTLKRLVLELGGNDAAIVLPGTDWKPLIPQLFWGAFLNSGQLCIATKRLFVPETIHAEFLAALVDYARGVTVGPGHDPASQMGPVQNRLQFDKLCGLLADCHARGLRFALGGALPDAGQEGYFLPPAILDNPPDDSRIVREEQFGPVLPVLRYATIDEAIARANDTPMGLGASVWGTGADAVAARLRAGTVWVNEIHVFGADLPMAGHGQSGLGAERGLAGLRDCTDLKVVSHARTSIPATG